MQDQNLLKQAILENEAKKVDEKMTGNRLASKFGLSGARISQIKSRLKAEGLLTADTPEPVSEAQEA